MTDHERTILKLMYDLQIEHARYQAEEVAGLKHALAGLSQAIDGATRAIDSLERSQAILAKLMKATGELMGVH